MGTTQYPSGEYRAYLWERGEVIDLGTLGSNISAAIAINKRGQVIGISQLADDPDHIRAVLWSR
jgi:probable HAF family extracellular repeat protein